jgi:anthranilate phosphoribosyltransferase
MNTQNETLTQYIAQYSNKPKWELLNMKKALQSMGGFLNTDSDNIRLEAVLVALKLKRKAA